MAPTAPTSPAGLRALLEAHAREAAELPEAALRELRPLLEAARHELNRDLAAWAAARKGDARYTPLAYRQSLAAIESAEAVARQRLDLGVLAALVNHDRVARLMANRHATAELLAFAAAGDITIGPQVPLRVAALLQQSRRAPMARYESSAARYAGAVMVDVRRELAVGVLRGEATDALIARLARHGGPRGAVAVRGIAGTPGTVVEVIPGGLFRRYEYWGERLIRTELASAYTEQVEDLVPELRADLPGLTRVWDASQDMRVCPRCGGMNGTVADPVTGKFPGGVDVPLHPNCRCRAGLWRPSWDAFGLRANYTRPTPS